MTDKAFFHPETGKPMHQVPVGATIPAGTPSGWIERSGTRHFGTLTRDFAIEPCAHPHFTAEPIAPPMPPLPTEVGTTIRAMSRGGCTCAMLTLDSAGYWVGVTTGGGLVTWKPAFIADWGPVRAEPNGTGVLDETDKRPVVDNRGHRWEWDETRDLWTNLGILHRGTKTTIDRDHGPLTLAGGDAS